MTDQQRIAEITARCEAATPGPWILSKNKNGFMKAYPQLGLLRLAQGLDELNAIFCCHARTDIPYLLDRLAEAEEELKQADDYIETYKDICDKHVETNRKLIAEVKRLREAINGIVWEWDNGHIEPYSPYMRDYIDQLRPLPAAPEEGESK